MDDAINEAKAPYFSPRNEFPRVALPRPGVRNYNERVTSAYGKAANNLANVGMAARFMAFDETIALFRTTHERLYQLYVEIDDYIECNRQGQPGASPTWAATYSQWMTR